MTWLRQQLLTKPSNASELRFELRQLMKMTLESPTSLASRIAARMTINTNTMQPNVYCRPEIFAWWSALLRSIAIAA